MKNLSAFLFLLLTQVTILSAQKKSRVSVMETLWTNEVDKNLPRNEYPRPHLKRKEWQNLNGQWNYAIQQKSGNAPDNWDGKILVPFPVESYLSGVQKRVGLGEELWYKRTFSIKNHNPADRVILHFGAVDYESKIVLNGKEVYAHKGGYTSFSLDITPYLTGGEEELMVNVLDPTDEGKQPRGKQVKKPEGIYYTPVTGIWQTVWYETVPSTYLKSYKLTTDIDASTVSINPKIYNAAGEDQILVKVLQDSKTIAEKSFGPTDEIKLSIPNVQLWSPQSPTLYDLEIDIIRNNKVLDRIKGYFGMRKIEVSKDGKGQNRILLNGEALFQYGSLDQGYWPDGIYTAPTEAALLSDIENMKAMGFNMVRKHVKVEPARWYYHCDRLGLIVWQDMPSGYGEIVPIKDHDYSTEGDWMNQHYKDVDRNYESEKDFRMEWQEIIGQLYNHPSICVWVPFNESWGQFKTNEILEWTKSLDPTRLVDGPSGWIDRNGGEIRDYHLYGDRLYKDFLLEDKRALVIGEFGGLGYAVKDHLYSNNAWSYQGFKDGKELGAAYDKLLHRVVALKNKGFSAAIYTQLTDVETEINGLLTYDRKVTKIPVKQLNEMHKKLYEDDK